jgi:hypothetical protein
VKFHTVGCALSMVTAFAALPAVAQESEAQLAKEALNPVADLISLPIKYDYNTNIGPTEQGNQSVLTVQPVIPLSIGTDWNLILRTIIPAINQHNLRPGTGTPAGLGDVATGSGTEEGLGDTTQQFYFSPKKPTDSGGSGARGRRFCCPPAAAR